MTAIDMMIVNRAEFFATIGFPLLNRSIKAFQDRYEDKIIEVCGLVFNDFDRGGEKREHRLAREDVQEKADQFGWYVFENDIPHSDSYFRASRDGMPIVSTKGAHDRVKGEFVAFATGFFERIHL